MIQDGPPFGLLVGSKEKPTGNQRFSGPLSETKSRSVWLVKRESDLRNGPVFFFWRCRKGRASASLLLV